MCVCQELESEHEQLSEEYHTLSIENLRLRDKLEFLQKQMNSKHEQVRQWAWFEGKCHKSVVGTLSCFHLCISANVHLSLWLVCCDCSKTFCMFKFISFFLSLFLYLKKGHNQTPTVLFQLVLYCSVFTRLAAQCSVSKCHYFSGSCRDDKREEVNASLWRCGSVLHVTLSVGSSSFSSNFFDQPCRVGYIIFYLPEWQVHMHSIWNLFFCSKWAYTVINKVPEEIVPVAKKQTKKSADNSAKLATYVHISDTSFWLVF